MTKFFIKYTIAFLLLIPAQAIVFNHAMLFNVAVPLVFLWLIISLPLPPGTNPSAQTMGHGPYMKYMLTMVLIYCTMAFTIEAFQFFTFRLLLLRIIASSAYTFVLLYGFDCLMMRRGESYS